MREVSCWDCNRVSPIDTLEGYACCPNCGSPNAGIRWLPDKDDE